VDGVKRFVKFAPHSLPDAVRWLQNAQKLYKEAYTPPMVPLIGPLELSDGLALMYHWVEGECLNETKPSLRPDLKHPDSAHSRFKALPVDRLTEAMDSILACHSRLEQKGYVACDWYDGCILYNFIDDTLALMDFDLYHKGPFVNEMGRMYGSSRFMSPEEFTLGAAIDSRTTVFNLGATILEFMGNGLRGGIDGFRGNARQRDVAQRGVSVDREQRYASVSDLLDDWRQASIES
jgi:serine/threonine-protein kinase